MDNKWPLPYIKNRININIIIIMKTILLKLTSVILMTLLGVVLSGCSLMVAAAGGFGKSGAYSGWKSVRHGGEKFLVNPYEKGEFYLKKYDCFLWNSLDCPVKMMIGYLLLYTEEFPYFCVYQRGTTEKFDIREKTDKSYDVDGLKIRLQINYAVFKKALVTIINQHGDSKQFEMRLSAVCP